MASKAAETGSLPENTGDDDEDNEVGSDGDPDDFYDDSDDEEVSRDGMFTSPLDDVDLHTQVEHTLKCK